MSKRQSKFSKERLFDIIQIGQRYDFPSRAFDYFLVTAIIVNINVLLLQTFDFSENMMKVFNVIEIITVVIFTIDHLLRIWTADLLYKDTTKFNAVIKYLASFDGVVNILSILPVFFLSGFSALRIIRAVRIFHLFRINARYDSFNVIVHIIKIKSKQIVASLLILFILMLTSSLCMYSIENPVQPDNFKNAFSGLWWSISTILTVGYGDIYPMTTLGKTFAIVIAILGVGVVAIPTGIISAGFIEYHNSIENNKSNNILRKLINDYDNLNLKEIEKLHDIIKMINTENKGIDTSDNRLD